MALTVDQIMDEIGGFGRYQIIMVFIFGYVVIAIDCFPTMVVTFIIAEPDWICVKGENSVCNFTEPVTLTSKHYDARCSMPRENWTYVDGFSSTVTEYDLVCEKSYLLSVAQSCFWVGALFGLLFSGYLSDRFGRKPVFYAGVVGTVVTTWVMVFPKDFGVFIAGRLINGIASGFLSTMYVLIAEYTAIKHRAKVCLSLFYFWAIGLLLLALLGYLIEDWRHLLLATAAIATPCLPLWWFTPESTRWLLIKGKKEKARQELGRVAKRNKIALPEGELEKPESSITNGSFKHLFQNWKIAKTTLICWNLWFTVALVYFGVTYGTVDLGWNRYLTFALTSLVEFPSDYASIWSANRFGRKRSNVVGLVVSTLASIVAISIPADQSHTGYIATRIAMAAVARFFINLAYSCVYVWSIELFPTFVRSMAFSTCSMSSKVGAFAASYVIWLIRIHPLLPYGIMGFMCLQSAILTFSLPETYGKPTLETMEDMNWESPEDMNLESPEDMNWESPV